MPSRNDGRVVCTGFGVRELHRGTATVCITSSVPISNLSGGCHGQDLSFAVDISPFQSPVVILNIRRPGLVLGMINVHVNGAGAAANVVIVPQQGGSLAQLGGIRQSGGTGELWIGGVTVAGSITGGFIEASSVNSVIAGGNIAVPITSLGSPLNGQGQPGAIGEIVSTSGSILDDITAGQRIELISAPSGTVGAVADPVDIRSLGDLYKLESTAIYAAITTRHNATPQNPGGNIRHLLATNGPMVGSIVTLALDSPFATDGIFVASSFDANATFQGSINRAIAVGGSLFSGRELSIGGNLNSAQYISFAGALLGNVRVGGSLLGSLNVGAQGLGGQIVINRNNAAGTWTGPVTVGGTTLAPTPAYAQASVSLGGGAVGVVPFQYYAADTDASLPQGLFNATLANPNPPGLGIAFYGPVYAAPAPALPIDVYLRSASGTEILVNNSISATIDRAGTDAVLSRTLKLTSTFARPLLPNPAGWTYVARVGPRVGGVAGVFCDLADASAIPVTPRDVLFSLEPDCDGDGIPDDIDPDFPCETQWGYCSADFNLDGTLDFFDYEDFLACYEGTFCPPDTTADFNADGSTDFFDYDDYVLAFQTGCG